jgi:predicted dehydrogenase
LTVTDDTALAVVGVGYWGPNLVRCAFENDGCIVKTICDPRPDALSKLRRRFPAVEPTHELDRVLGDGEIDGVMIATPVTTHYDLVKRCLLAGKNVMVEKPLSTTAEESRELIELAGERGLVLMPAHTFIYSPPVNKVKQLLDNGELGEIYFGTSSRVNLGIHQSDVSVVRDLAPHDFSILLYWLGRPEFVRAIGRASIIPENLDVAFIDLGYPDGALFHVELSWLAPTKLRRTVLVGTERMVVYEDTSAEQVRIFDRGVDSMPDHQTFGEFQLSYRSGDVLTPRIPAEEPLRLEIQDFVEAIRNGSEPLSNARLGHDVVRMIEATEASLEYNSAPVPLDDDGRRQVADRRKSQGGMPVVRSSKAFKSVSL